MPKFLKTKLKADPRPILTNDRLSHFISTAKGRAMSRKHKLNHNVPLASLMRAK